MLQTNLLGRYFKSNFTKTNFRVVAVYIHSQLLYVIGEDEKGNLSKFNFDDMTLMQPPRAADENLLGVV